MRFGLDFLGLARYADVARKEWPEGWALGCFSSTFGDSRPAVEGILKTGKCPSVRIHIGWDDDHALSKRDFPALVREAQSWKGLIAKYPHVQWYMSGICEHRLDVKDATELARLISAAVPVMYVNCPERSQTIKGYLNEVHGGKSKPPPGNCTFSFDNEKAGACDSDIVNVRKRFDETGHTELFFLWEPRFNGRWETDDTTPRPKRKGWPDDKLIRSVIKLFGECGRVSLSKGRLYKSHSENGGPDPRTGEIDKRAEKPVIIIPEKVDAVMLGNHRCKRYYRPHSDGRWRYYATKWGYEIGTKPVSIKIGNHIIGVVNPAFRLGEFR